MTAKLKRLNGLTIRKKLKFIKHVTVLHRDLIALWLFGSYAKDCETPLSDIDIAYLPTDGLTASRLERLDCRLYRDLSQLLETDEITLVNIKEAPVHLAFEILKGKALFIKDRAALAHLKEKVLQLYPEVRGLRHQALLEDHMPIDKDKISEQLRLLRADLKKLKEKSKFSKKAYLEDEDSKTVVERKFQTAIETCVNIGNHLISALDLKLAEDYASVFLNLAKGKVISQKLAERMADMARFRNLLVHLYWKIDHAKIHKEMGQRVKVLELFFKEITKFLKSLGLQRQI